jgi:superfamily II DNA or RNA helicase
MFPSVQYCSAGGHKGMISSDLTRGMILDRQPDRSALVRHVTDHYDMNLLNNCRQIARRTFRIQRLRTEQEAAMLAALKRRDALVALPTGFGKSLIYQVPAMMLERRRSLSHRSLR